MAVTNFTSAKHIIAKILRDTPVVDASWTNDALTWIGEAIQAIGVFNGFETKTTSLAVTGHRAKLPCYAESILQVVYQGCTLNVGGRHATANMHRKESVNGYYASTTPVGITEATAGNDPYDNPFKVLTRTAGVWEHDTYLINGGWFNTTFEEGTIYVDYHSIKTDEEGFPMIPNNYSFKEAVVWYITKKMHFRNGNIEMAEYCEQKWLTYCRQAANDCIFPSVARVERLVDMFVNLMPVSNYSNVKDYDYRRYSN